MSAPSRYAKEAEQIKYSFLAAKAKESINKVLSNETLEEEDTESLNRAIEFLTSVSMGAQFVSSGEYSGEDLSSGAVSCHSWGSWKWQDSALLLSRRPACRSQIPFLSPRSKTG